MIAIIRIRGKTGIKPFAEKTAELLNLNRINHMVMFPESESLTGMLNRVKDYVTWGEIDQETIELLFKDRILLNGRKKITEDYAKVLGYSSIAELAKAMFENKVKIKDLENVKPVVRLNPPKGGYEAIQKPFHQKGSAGYRGSKINSLIKRMIVPGVDLNGKDKN
ncbi:50S ribosomal protein L30 [Ferroplasma sp.]|uniref:50S ribosomal protein L30 n=1 Tax=Ferroplasma sp. TaxID=2591003 RepID=UPI00307FA818